MNRSVVSILVGAFGGTALPAAAAEELDVHHGAVEGPVSAIVETGLVTTFQHASADEARDEWSASFDLLTGVPIGRGLLTVHLEGPSSPSSRGVTGLLPDANADVGTALDENGHGRIQISELHYSFHSGARQFFVGLLNPAGFIDTSDVANDETRQFLSATLVNNPTVEMPDYVLGAALHKDAEEKRPGFTFLLTSSHGLADNPERSYSQLFELNAEGKGVFAAAELHWQLGDLKPRIGLWTQTAEHARLKGTSEQASNAGLYGVLDGAAGEMDWNLRAGIADARVSASAWFVGAALERSLGAAVLGSGITYTALSGEARDTGPALSDTTQSELYVRFGLGKSFEITPSLQYVRNPGFDGSGELLDEEVWIVGARFSAAF